MEAAAQPLVVAVVGSPRRGGNTAVLVAAALGELSARGARCETVFLAQHDIAPCLAHDGCAEFAACPLGDDAASVLDQVYAADCLVLASPVYYENVSAQMKAFIDRNLFRYSHDEWLRATAIGLIAVNHVRAGSLPPNRFPSPHCLSGNEHNSPGVLESS